MVVAVVVVVVYEKIREWLWPVSAGKLGIEARKQ